MTVVCVYCTTPIPLPDTSTHDANCIGHSHHTPTGWTRCVHNGPCYTPEQAAA